MVSPEKGAGQLVWLAEGTPGRDWKSGTYYEGYKLAKRNNPQALDDALARQLWDRTEALSRSEETDCGPSIGLLLVGPAFCFIGRACNEGEVSGPAQKIEQNDRPE
jgi:hypothetical protein